MASDRPLRLALVSSGLGHELRGIEMWMADLARYLPAGVAVEILAGGRTPQTSQMRPTRRIWNLGRHHPLLRGCSWMRRYQVEQYSALPAALLRLRMSRPAVAYCGDPLLAWNLKRFRRWHGARVVFMNGMRLTPRWLRGYDGVHLLAPQYLTEARSLLPPDQAERFFAVPHFADTAQFHPPTPAQRRAARAEWKLPPDAFVVLTVGPLGRVSGKRLDFLAGEVAAASPTAILVSAGGDEDGADAVRAHAGRVLGARFRALGRIERSHIGSLYHAADAYSLGSLAEPFSIAIIEALASGLPVVHHHDEVMTWQTGPGGVAVSMETPGAAAAALRSLAAEPDRRAVLARAARTLAEQRYAPAQACAALEGELRRIAARPAFWR